MKSQTPKNRFPINVVYWSQAADLLSENYALNAYPVPDDERFFVAFEHPTERNHLFVIDRNATSALPMKIDALSIFQQVVTYGEADTLTFPLTEADPKILGRPRAILHVPQPKKLVQWKLMIDGEWLLGGRNRPLRFDKLQSALNEAKKLGAKAATLQISASIRLYFRQRLLRVKWITDVLEPQQLNLKTWCLENDYDYATVHRVVLRGDDIPEIKKLLADLCGKTVDDMWPELKWDAG